MIEALGLHKSFGNVNAVQDVSFVARDGEITGLLGQWCGENYYIAHVVYVDETAAW